MDEKDLFAAPTQEELSDEELFAPPSAEDLEIASTQEVEEQSMLEDIGDTLKDVAISAGKGTGLGGIAAGIGSVLMPDPTADVDEQLRKEGFVLPSKPSVMEDYYEGRAGFEREVELASERSPYLSTAAQIAGGIGTATGAGALAGAAGLGKLAGAKQALETYNKLKDAGRLGKIAAYASSGAAANAAYNALDGKARTLEGVRDAITEGDLTELENTMNEIARGGVIGAAFGGGMGVLGGIGSAIGKTKPGQAFKKGLEGIKLSGRTQDVSDELNELSKGFINRINQAQDNIGAQMTNIVNESKKKIDLVDFFDKAKQELDMLKDTSLLKTKDKKKLAKFFDYYLDQDVYRNVDPAEVQEIARHLKKISTDFAGKSSMKTDEMKRFAESMSRNLNDYVKQEIPGLSKIYDKYSKVKDIQELAKFSKAFRKSDAFKQQERLTKTFAGAIDKGTSGFEKQRQIKEMLKKYEQLFGREAAEKTTRDLIQKQATLDLAQLANTDISHSVATNPANIFAQLAGGTYGGLLKGSNWMGRMSKDLSVAPEYIKQIGTIFRDKANLSPKNAKIMNTFAEQLDEIALLPQETRATKMYALIQQPAFRESAKAITELADNIVGEGDYFRDYDDLKTRKWKDVLDKNREMRKETDDQLHKAEQERLKLQRQMLGREPSSENLLEGGRGQYAYFRPQTSNVDLDVSTNLLDALKKAGESIGETDLTISSGKRSEEKTKKLLGHFKNKFGARHSNPQVQQLIDDVLLRAEEKYYANTNWRNEFKQQAKDLGLSDKDINRFQKKIEKIRKTYGGMQSGHLLGSKVDVPYSHFVDKYGKQEGMKKVREFKRALRKQGIEIIDEPKTGRHGVLDLRLK